MSSSKRTASSSEGASASDDQLPPRYPGLGYYRRDIKPLPRRQVRKPSKFYRIREKKSLITDSEEDSSSDSSASTDLGTALSLSDIEDQIGSPLPPSPYSENERMASPPPMTQEDVVDIDAELDGDAVDEMISMDDQPLATDDAPIEDRRIDSAADIEEAAAEYRIDVPAFSADKGKGVDPEERGRSKRRRIEEMNDLEQEVNDADDEMEAEGLLEEAEPEVGTGRSPSEEYNVSLPDEN